MSPKLRPVSGAEVIRVLERLGYVRVRQRGSHIILKKTLLNGGELGCVVPLHQELPVGTLRNILRQAEITPDEFIKSL